MPSRDLEAIPQPVLPSGLHSDVLREVQESRSNGRPWTKIRELRKGVDDSSGAQCIGSMGNHHLECKKSVEGVQYSTAYGDPLFYCEEHALKTQEWDTILYDSRPKPLRKLEEDRYDDVKKLFEKMDRRRRKKEEKPEEVDPTA